MNCKPRIFSKCIVSSSAFHNTYFDIESRPHSEMKKNCNANSKKKKIIIFRKCKHLAYHRMIFYANGN